LIFCVALGTNYSGKATDWMTGVQFPLQPGIFIYATTSRLAMGPTQPPIQQVPGVLSSWVEQLGCGVGH